MTGYDLSSYENMNTSRSGISTPPKIKSKTAASRNHQWLQYILCYLPSFSKAVSLLRFSMLHLPHFNFEAAGQFLHFIT